MILFDKIRDAVMGNLDVTETRLSSPVNTIANKTVLGDILKDPERYKIEAYMEGKEVVIKVKPREEIVVDVI